MAFTLANWAEVSVSLNQGQETVNVFGVGNTVLNAQNIFAYASPTDTQATIAGANYFLPQYASLSVGDWIMANGTDANAILVVATVSSTGVTTNGLGTSGTVNTANIVNNAVTYAKIQQASANTLIGNPTGGTANVEEVTLGNGLSFTGTTLGLPLSFARQATVNLTLSQFQGMYATPVQLLAAPGAGLMHIVDSVYVDFVFGSAALTAGGAVGAQYGNTIHLGGTPASATEAASDYTGAAASTMFRFGGSLSTGAPVASAANVAVFLSNATAAFTGGTGGSFVVTVNYRTVAAS